MDSPVNLERQVRAILSRRSRMFKQTSSSNAKVLQSIAIKVGLSDHACSKAPIKRTPLAKIRDRLA